MKLLELIDGNLLKKCHFTGFFANVSKYYCNVFANSNVTVKSII